MTELEEEILILTLETNGFSKNEISKIFEIYKIKSKELTEKEAIDYYYKYLEEMMLS